MIVTLQTKAGEKLYAFKVTTIKLAEYFLATRYIKLLLVNSFTEDVFQQKSNPSKHREVQTVIAKISFDCCECVSGVDQLYRTPDAYHYSLHPILDTSISCSVRPSSVRLTVPPFNSATGWTGELWSKTKFLILEN